MSEVGRPTVYQDTYVSQAEKLCQLGATDMEVAEFFEVDVRTIYRWKHEYADFCAATQAGKERADERVERALYNRAVGYSYDSEKLFQHQGTVIRADTREHVPPDPGAAMNWLKNRKPETWRDKQSHELSGLDGKPIEVRTVTDTQRAKAAAFLMAKVVRARRTEDV